MAEYNELETLKANGSDGGNTIRTHFAEIIVRGTADKPYYEILYFDTEDRSYHIGFGSYYLEYVFKWLSEEFETVADWQTSDIAPVRHGRWIDRIVDENEVIQPWMKRYYCSECLEGGSQSWFKFCPNCGAKMDLEG